MITEKEFGDVLDGYFVQHPDNEALLELEWCTGELEKSIKLIGGHCRRGTEGYHKIDYRNGYDKPIRKNNGYGYLFENGTRDGGDCVGKS